MRNLSEIALAAISLQRLEQLGLDKLRARKERHFDKNGELPTVWEIWWAGDIERLSKEERHAARKELAEIVKRRLLSEKYGDQTGSREEHRISKPQSNAKQREEDGHVYPKPGSLQQGDQHGTDSHGFASPPDEALAYPDEQHEKTNRSDGSSSRSSKTRSQSSRSRSRTSQRPYLRGRPASSLPGPLSSSGSRSRSNQVDDARHASPPRPPLATISEPERSAQDLVRNATAEERRQTLEEIRDHMLQGTHYVLPEDVSRPSRPPSPAVSNNPSILIDLASKHDDARKNAHGRDESIHSRSGRNSSISQNVRRSSSQASQDRQRPFDPAFLGPDDAQDVPRSYRSRSRSKVTQSPHSGISNSSKETWERSLSSQASSASRDAMSNEHLRHDKGEAYLPIHDAPSWGFGNDVASPASRRSGNHRNMTAESLHGRKSSSQVGTVSTDRHSIEDGKPAPSQTYLDSDAHPDTSSASTRAAISMNSRGNGR